MKTLFKKRLINFFIQLIALSGLLFGIHSYLNFYFAKNVVLFFPLWHIYLFHLTSVLIIYTIVNYLDSEGKTHIFNTFIMGMFLKMILTFVFLLPWILSKPEQKGYDLFNFFAPYFIFLAFEVYSVTNILQKK